tara:strand:- start:2376 stop:3173 length:798 start_codon:yes stop_codon:yes gene_type:complete
LIELNAVDSINAWIDTYHAVYGVTSKNRYVFLTDSAIGQREEHSIRHLVTNLGDDAPRERVIPFLTAKHSLDYCLGYADRASENNFRTLVVVGGDNAVGPARCVAHGWQLRELIRKRQPHLELGGWVNPTKDTQQQIEYLMQASAVTDFYLTQVVSHHHLEKIENFLITSAKNSLKMPGVFGVFYYRSGNQQTLNLLSQFLPVPRTQLIKEFSSGLTAEQICARSIQTLRRIGIKHFYISNLPVDRAPSTLNTILNLAANDLEDS